MVTGKSESLARCGSHQPSDGANTNSRKHAASTTPKKTAHHLFTAETPSSCGSRSRYRLKLLLLLRRKLELPFAAVDDLAYIFRQHVGIGQGPEEVDQVPGVLVTAEDVLGRLRHVRGRDTAVDPVIQIKRPAPAAIDSFGQ